MKKIIIIGAGIAGLSTGIYGKKNGFNTEIYEMHSIPGGECTGWRRKGYYFDGCIHWLMGSKKGNELNNVWNEVGALDDSIGIVNHDYFYSYEEDGIVVYLYRNINKLKNHLMEVAPEDSKMINYLCKAIEKLKCVEIPTKKPFDFMNGLDIFKMLFEMFPSFKYLPKLEKITIEEFVSEFKSPILRNAFTMLIPSNYKATSLISTMSSMADGDSGWPLGGSLEFSKRVENKYKSLGGKIFYNSRVKKILIKDGQAKGIFLEDGTEKYADYVISTADGYATLFKMLEGKYISDQLKTMYADSESYPVYTSVQVSLGIDHDLSNYPHTRFIKLESNINGGGNDNSFLGFRHFCYDNTIMPKGKSSLVTMLYADFNWWKKIYDDKDSYRRKKELIADEVIKIAEQFYPEIIGKIETIDVATPMTYVRYCDAWQGSWMAWATTPKGKIRYIPGDLPGLNNFYLAGQWTLPPGGLPTAVITGKWVIQRLCKVENKKFVTNNK